MNKFRNRSAAETSTVFGGRWNLNLATDMEVQLVH